MFGSVKMTAWLVGRWADPTALTYWVIVGVFDSRDKAVAACRDASYFLVDVDVNRQYDFGPPCMGVDYPRRLPGPPPPASSIPRIRNKP